MKQVIQIEIAYFIQTTSFRFLWNVEHALERKFLDFHNQLVFENNTAPPSPHINGHPPINFILLLIRFSLRIFQQFPPPQAHMLKCVRMYQFLPHINLQIQRKILIVIIFKQNTSHSLILIPSKTIEYCVADLDAVDCRVECYAECNIAEGDFWFEGRASLLEKSTDLAVAVLYYQTPSTIGKGEFFANDYPFATFRAGAFHFELVCGFVDILQLKVFRVRIMLIFLNAKRSDILRFILFQKNCFACVPFFGNFKLPPHKPKTPLIFAQPLFHDLNNILGIATKHQQTQQIHHMINIDYISQRFLHHFQHKSLIDLFYFCEKLLFQGLQYLL